MPISDTAARNAKPESKPKKLFDSGGLFLLVQPTGGKLWRLKYRIDGKEKLLALGAYPDVSLKDARKRRDEARNLLADGIDPGAQRKTEKAQRKAEAANSFENVARAWLAHRADAWVERTRTLIWASLERYALPALGSKPIAEIQPADVRAVVQAIEAAGATETAGRVFQRVRSIFRYAVAHDLVKTDPTYPLKPAEIFKPRKVAHRAALAEKDVPAFLRQLGQYEGDPTTRHALELLMLTAVRPGELRGARWDEFDTERALWRIPAERMKMKTEHLVPLAAQALKVLDAIKPLTGSDVLVFPSPYYPGKALSENTFNSALARMGYKGIATAHGFRALFSTVANEHGWRADVIERQLAHEERDDVRGAYNRAQYLTERTQLVQWWADHLDKLRKGADVIPFKTA